MSIPIAVTANAPDEDETVSGGVPPVSGQPSVETETAWLRERMKGIENIVGGIIEDPPYWETELGDLFFGVRVQIVPITPPPIDESPGQVKWSDDPQELLKKGAPILWKILLEKLPPLLEESFITEGIPGAIQNTTQGIEQWMTEHPKLTAIGSVVIIIGVYKEGPPIVKGEIEPILGGVLPGDPMIKKIPLPWLPLGRFRIGGEIVVPEGEEADPGWSGLFEIRW